MTMDDRTFRAKQLTLAWSLVVLAVCGWLIATPRAQPGAGAPGMNRCIAVTTSDTVDLPDFTQRQALTAFLYVGGAGAVQAVMSDGSVVGFAAAVAGFTIPIGVRRVNATNTVATGIVACYRI